MTYTPRDLYERIVAERTRSGLPLRTAMRRVAAALQSDALRLWEDLGEYFLTVVERDLHRTRPPTLRPQDPARLELSTICGVPGHEADQDRVADEETTSAVTPKGKLSPSAALTQDHGNGRDQALSDVQMGSVAPLPWFERAAWSAAMATEVALPGLPRMRAAALTERGLRRAAVILRRRGHRSLERAGQIDRLRGLMQPGDVPLGDHDPAALLAVRPLLLAAGVTVTGQDKVAMGPR
jgi:hypothetical protein